MFKNTQNNPINCFHNKEVDNFIGQNKISTQNSSANVYVQLIHFFDSGHPATTRSQFYFHLLSGRNFNHFLLIISRIAVGIHPNKRTYCVSWRIFSSQFVILQTFNTFVANHIWISPLQSCWFKHDMIINNQLVFSSFFGNLVQFINLTILCTYINISICYCITCI